MNSPTKDRYASALKELSLLGGQIAYHFPDYQAILGNVQPRGTRALFRQQTRLMAVVEGVAIIKIGNSTIKELASTHRHSNALTEAFKSYYGGEKINLVFICDDDIIKPPPKELPRDKNGQASIFDILESEYFKSSPKGGILTNPKPTK
jgi:hypothetical protein